MLMVHNPVSVMMVFRFSNLSCSVFESFPRLVNCVVDSDVLVSGWRCLSAQVHMSVVS